MRKIDFSKPLDRSKPPFNNIFYPYCPFSTFTNKGVPEFLDKNNKSTLKGWFDKDKHLPKNNTDLAEIFEIGLKAYEALFIDCEGQHVATFEEFEIHVATHYKESLRMLKKMDIQVVNSQTKKLIPIEELDNSQIVEVAWEALSYKGDIFRIEHSKFFIFLFAIATLEEIGNLLVSLCLGIDDRDALTNMRIVQQCYSRLEQIKSNESIISQYKSAIAKEAINARLANDPKQQEKLFIYECWQDWQDGKTNYSSKASFARDMLTKVKHITSHKSIESWCRSWEKERPLH